MASSDFEWAFDMFAKHLTAKATTTTSSESPHRSPTLPGSRLSLSPDTSMLSPSKSPMSLSNVLSGPQHRHHSEFEGDGDYIEGREESGSGLGSTQSTSTMNSIFSSNIHTPNLNSTQISTNVKQMWRLTQRSELSLDTFIKVHHQFIISHTIIYIPLYRQGWRNSKLINMCYCPNAMICSSRSCFQWTVPSQRPYGWVGLYTVKKRDVLIIYIGENRRPVPTMGGHMCYLPRYLHTGILVHPQWFSWVRHTLSYISVLMGFNM